MKKFNHLDFLLLIAAVIILAVGCRTIVTKVDVLHIHDTLRTQIPCPDANVPTGQVQDNSGDWITLWLTDQDSLNDKDVRYVLLQSRYKGTLDKYQYLLRHPKTDTAYITKIINSNDSTVKAAQTITPTKSYELTRDMWFWITIFGFPALVLIFLIIKRNKNKKT